MLLSLGISRVLASLVVFASIHSEDMKRRHEEEKELLKKQLSSAVEYVRVTEAREKKRVEDMEKKIGDIVYWAPFIGPW